MSDTSRILVNAASGQLGRLVVESLLGIVPPTRIVAGARTPSRLADLAAKGVEVREADYARPETLAAAYRGVDRILVISSNEFGQRAVQHRNAIEAARAAGAALVAYTSLLHADTSPLALRTDHLATEAALRDSGLPFVVLRNGWYTENFNGFIPSALEHGVLAGSAGEGRISAAARADYAEAAARVLAEGESHAGRIHELAGDRAFTKADWAAALSSLSGRPVAYRDMPEADYRALLLQVGLPAPYADLLADSDTGTAEGGLFDDSGTLGRLIGRSTATLDDVLAKALAA